MLPPLRKPSETPPSSSVRSFSRSRAVFARCLDRPDAPSTAALPRLGTDGVLPALRRRVLRPPSPRDSSAEYLLSNDEGEVEHEAETSSSSPCLRELPCLCDPVNFGDRRFVDDLSLREDEPVALVAPRSTSSCPRFFRRSPEPPSLPLFRVDDDLFSPPL